MMGSFRGIQLVSVAALAIFLTFNSNNSAVDVVAEDIDSQVIRDACKVATNPNFCFSMLSSDARSRGKTVSQLTHLSIVKSNEKGKEGRNIVSDVRKTATDPLVKKILDYCSGQYDVVMGGTAEALKDFDNSKYELATFGIAMCIETLEDCNDAFKTPGVSGNVIQNLNDFVTNNCFVALDLVNSFVGK